MIFFTSDIHFGQQSLLATGKWKERPFNTLEEMIQTIDQQKPIDIGMFVLPAKGSGMYEKKGA